MSTYIYIYIYMYIYACICCTCLNIDIFLCVRVMWLLYVLIMDTYNVIMCFTVTFHLGMQTVQY